MTVETPLELIADLTRRFIPDCFDLVFSEVIVASLLKPLDFL